MVRRYSDSGKSSWLEPPYTPEEEEEIGPINNVVGVLRSTKAVSQPSPTEDTQDK